MPTLSERWSQHRLVAVLPTPPADTPESINYSVSGLIAPVEVMVQEGISVMALPLQALEADAHLIHSLNGIFASRAEFGVYGVGSLEQTHQVADAGATFAMLRWTAPDELDAMVVLAGERSLPILPQALTPSEVGAVWAKGVSAVQVTPADAFGASYPEQLHALVDGVATVPRGGLGAHSAGRWLDAGAIAVCLDEALIGDAFTGGSLVGLRERCQVFSDVAARYR